MWPFTKKEERIASSDPFLGEYLGARWTAVADIDKASGLAVAHRAISVIAENLASVPLSVYRKTEDGGREKASEHPLYGVVHDQSSPSLSAFEAREMLIASVLTHGNGYARIERNGRGQVSALFPLMAGSVTVERLANGRLRYKHALANGTTEVLLQEEMLHLRYRTKDGILGMSPIQIAASTFGLAIAQTDQAGAQAANAFRPAGALIFADKIGGPQAEEYIAKFKARMTGQLKSNELLVLDGGAKFETISTNNKDSEFIESRKLSNLDICRVYGVPPSVCGITDDSSYSNAQEESRALVSRCLAPMAARIEQAMNIALLSPDARKSGLYLEHDLAGLLRGDLATRYAAYRIGREGGWLSSDEIRGFENMSKIPGGDTYVEPLNMGRLGANNNEPAKVAA